MVRKHKAIDHAGNHLGIKTDQVEWSVVYAIYFLSRSVAIDCMTNTEETGSMNARKIEEGRKRSKWRLCHIHTSNSDALICLFSTG